MPRQCTRERIGVARLLRQQGLEGCAFLLLAGAFGGIAFSIALGQTLAGLCFALTLAGLATRRIPFRWPAQTWFAVAFGAVAVVSVLAGVDPRGLWNKAGELCWFLLIPVTLMLVRTPDRARALVLSFVAGCAIQGLETALLKPCAAWRHPAPDFMTALVDRGSMTDGQMLMLGVSVTVAFLVLTWRSDRALVRGLLLALVLEAGGLLLNFKRGSWFCAVLLVGGVVLAHARRRTWVILLAVLALVVSLPPVRARLGQLEREFDAGGGGRLTMWTRVTPALVRDYPQGVGYGALTNDLMRKAYARVERNRNHVHANWAQILVETGWAGLAVYAAWMAWLVGAAARQVRSGRDRPGPERAVALAVLLILLGLLLNGAVEYNFGDSELMMVLAVAAGLLAAQRRLGSLSPAPATPASPSGAVA